MHVTYNDKLCTHTYLNGNWGVYNFNAPFSTYIIIICTLMKLTVFLHRYLQHNRIRRIGERAFKGTDDLREL